MAFFTTLPNFIIFRSKVFEIQSFRSFEIFLYIVWQNGLEDISCPPTRLPPCKAKEILQNLSAHTFDMSKCINLKLWEHIQNGALYLFTFFLKITVNLNF